MTEGVRMNKINVKKIEYGYDYRDMSIEDFHDLLKAEELTEYNSTLTDLIMNVSLTLVRRSIEESWNQPQPKKERKVELPTDFNI
jgi:hypothetical protein